MKPLCLVRYGEISLKGASTRSFMEKQLINSIVYTLDSNEIPYSEVKLIRGRIFVYTNHAEEAAHALSKVFGVVSTSPAWEISKGLKEIEQAALKVFSKVVQRKCTFAVRARREDKGYPLTSMDLQRHLGSLILEKFKDFGISVDLENPGVTLFLEVRRTGAYLYFKVIRGVGGLPYATSGKVVALVSPGIDSPVAAWMMMRKGCEVVPVLCDFSNALGEQFLERWLKIAEILRRWAPSPSFEAVVVKGFDEVISEVAAKAGRYTCLACRRLMYLVGVKLAEKLGGSCVVTGESLAQVASQTLSNISSLSHNLPLPILRPLLAYDKEEIVNLAKRIGTYQAAITGKAPCPFTPAQPKTRSSRDEMLRLEERFSLVERAESLSKCAEVIKL